MAARHVGIHLQEEITDTNAPPAEFLSNNPLGKLPVLIREAVAPIYDSVAIMHFLDRYSGGKLYPAAGEQRIDAEVLEALCDGITDCLLAVVYERRFRPDEKVHEDWIARQWSKVTRALDHLEQNPPGLDRDLHGGHFSLAALLGYLDLRFRDKWEGGRPNLRSWIRSFEGKFSNYSSLKPLA